MMLVVGSPPVGSPMIQVPTNGWRAMAAGVPVWAARAGSRRPRAAAPARAPGRADATMVRRRIARSFPAGATRRPPVWTPGRAAARWGRLLAAPFAVLLVLALLAFGAVALLLARLGQRRVGDGREADEAKGAAGAERERALERRAAIVSLDQTTRPGIEAVALHGILLDAMACLRNGDARNGRGPTDPANPARDR